MCMSNDTPTTNLTSQPFSRSIADLVSGVHDLTKIPGGFNDEKPMYHRAHFLASLSELYSALDKIGWIEHTSDWDWYVIVTTTDGETHGDLYDEDDNQERGCDSFTFPSNLSEVPQSVDEVDYSDLELTLQFFTNHANVSIPLHRIRSIEINQR